EYLYSILETTYPTAKTEKNHNTDVGVALSILKNLTSTTKFFIAEFGAYKKGEIRKASYYIPLQYAILTGLGNQHLDLYGSRENLITEETYILKKITAEGTVYIPYNSPANSHLSTRLKAQTILYGMNKNADITAEILSADPYMQKAKIIYKKDAFIIETKLLGEHIIENLLPAIALALDVGVPVQNIITAIEQFSPITGKLSLHTGHKKSLVINDGVNSNVEGFISAIHTLHKFSHKQKIIVSQGIIELGVEKRASYKRILEEMYKTDILLYTTDALFLELTPKKYQKSIVTFNDVNLIQKKLLTTIDKHSAILIEGKFPKSFIECILI
ncbi:MAG TPA: Mur ligase family protein, partial [Candidatus Woesebacteria bacterium]|nr:Mur ligase family protein [Candidatus Woesebacteria bacterium]